jgi:hypothetical protein
MLKNKVLSSLWFIFFMACQALALEGLEELEEVPLLIESYDEESPIVFLLEEEDSSSIRVSVPKEVLEAAKSHVLNTLVEIANQSENPIVHLPVENIESFILVLNFLNKSKLEIKDAEVLAHLISYAHRLDIVPLGFYLQNLFDYPRAEKNFRNFKSTELNLIAERLAAANSGPKKAEDSRDYWAEHLSLKFGEYILRRGVAGERELYNNFKHRYKNNRAMKLALSHSIEGLRLCRSEINWRKGPRDQEMKDDKPIWLMNIEKQAKRNRASRLQMAEAQKKTKALLADKILPKLVDQTFEGKAKKIIIAVQASLAPDIARELKYKGLRVRIDPDLPLYDPTDRFEGPGVIPDLKCNKWQTNSFGSFIAHFSHCTSRAIGVLICPFECLTCGWCFCCGQRTNLPYDFVNNCLECRTGECCFYGMHDGCTFLHSGCKYPERTLVIESADW